MTQCNFKLVNYSEDVKNSCACSGRQDAALYVRHGCLTLQLQCLTLRAAVAAGLQACRGGRHLAARTKNVRVAMTPEFYRGKFAMINRLDNLWDFFNLIASTASRCGARLAGKDILNRGRCSRVLRAVLVERGVWLLPN